MTLIDKVHREFRGIQKKISVLLKRSVMTCETKTPCGPDFPKRRDPCCKFVNEELSTFMQSSTATFQKTLGKLNSSDNRECRQDKLRSTYNTVFTRTVAAFQAILDSECARFCCESAAAAIAKTSQAIFGLI